ncbi:MAG TPA: hypothetical protein VNL16_17775 [Chloroflexota bacterium]|nr:hypothetical protein [Chloroflexota bacterium]
MQKITHDGLTLWHHRDAATAPCTTCGRATTGRWEDESGLVAIAACGFGYARIAYQRLLARDHADGYHDGLPRAGCRDCTAATAAPWPCLPRRVE